MIYRFCNKNARDLLALQYLPNLVALAIFCNRLKGIPVRLQKRGAYGHSMKPALVTTIFSLLKPKHFIRFYFIIFCFVISWKPSSDIPIFVSIFFYISSSQIPQIRIFTCNSGREFFYYLVRDIFNSGHNKDIWHIFYVLPIILYIKECLIIMKN